MELKFKAIELKPRNVYVNCYMSAFCIFAGAILVGIRLSGAPISAFDKMVFYTFVVFPALIFSGMFLYLCRDVFRKISISEEFFDVKGLFRKKRIPLVEIKTVCFAEGDILSITTGRQAIVVDLGVFRISGEEMRRVVEMLKRLNPS